jgi:O-antigen ligase
MVLFALTFYEGLSPDRFSFDLRDMIDARFHLHPTYLSAAWLWAALLLLFERPFTQGIRIIMVVLLVVLALMMGGKMPFLAFIVALGLYTIIRISSLRKRGLALLIIGVIAVMNVVYNPMLNQRFGELVAPRTEFVDGQWLSSTEVRLGVWKCAWNVASNQWLTGVGVGKTRYSLEACYAKYNQQEFLDVELNSHNQFIHFVLIGGVFAGLAFLGTLLGFAYTAILRQHYELIVLLVFSGLIMLTENYLTRQSGMMLIAFGIMSRYFPVSRVQPS